MGSNVESYKPKNAHNNIIRTPLYSNGTPEMDIKRPVTTEVEGPEKAPAANTDYATQFDAK